MRVLLDWFYSDFLGPFLKMYSVYCRNHEFRGLKLKMAGKVIHHDQVVRLAQEQSSRQSDRHYSFVVGFFPTTNNK